MPIPVRIAAAAGEYAQNTKFLQGVTAGLTPEQWLTRPNDHSNHIAWIVGHVIWARQAVVTRLGGSWPVEGLEVYARSAKLDPAFGYHTPEALLALWRDSAAALNAIFESITEEQLNAPAPPGPPSPDGMTSGFIGVLAWHETYHVGQLGYLRGFLGLGGLMG